VDFPLLSAITYAPLIGALLIFFLPNMTRERARAIALVSGTVSFILSIWLLGAFDKNAEFQFVEHVSWLKGLGASYHLGVDGLAVPLIGLTTLISLIAIGWSWNTITFRAPEYYVALLLLETGMLGVFMALDLFVFYIFWEVMLIPMALLIGVWGSSNRVYAAVKFFIYTLFGSLLMLVGIVATYQAYADKTGERTLDILKLQQGWGLGAYGDVFQGFVFALFFIAFAVKIPMFPFHTWLPDAHVEAPTAASVILAAVMLKMGGYGMLRFNLPLFPEGSEDWAIWIVILSVIAIIYGSLVSLVQPDLKKLIAYSSVSHMGFVTLGIFVPLLVLKADRAAGQVQSVEHYLNGFNGSMMVMLAHGFNTGGLFLCVGVIYERAHTRLIARFGGLASRMPVYSALFGILMLASIGVPGFSGFIGEFLVALATFQYSKWVAFITFSVVIFAAWYMMWMFQRVIFGRQPEDMPDPHDTELTPEEVARLERAGLLGGHGHGEPLPVSGASHDAVSSDSDRTEPAEQTHDIKWPDLNRIELWCLLPLVALTIVFGVYPKPILDMVGPAFERILLPYMS
jgi:NADH-quinone oxidoreductase subunit M